MAKFPVDLTYYDRTISVLKTNNGFPSFPNDRDEFLGLMKFQDQSFYYIKTKKKGQFIDLDEIGKIYSWIACQMIIPEYFTKVDIDIYTPEDNSPPFITYLDIGEKLSKTYNGMFAMAINNRGLIEKIKSHEIDGLLETGQYSCAVQGYNEDSSNNLDQMFFRFRKHFFMPIILSNGVVIYYAFENENIIDELIKAAADTEGESPLIAVNAPIYYDNAFGIFITKQIRLVKPGEKQEFLITNYTSPI